MNDQRLINRLQNYWDLVRRGKPMPEINQFNAGPIEDLWPSCVKFEVAPAQGGFVYTYKYMGEKVQGVFGRDMTGMIVERGTKQYPYSVIIDKMGKVMEAKTIVLDENHFVNNSGVVIKYRACFMPFGNEKRGVTHIIVGLSDRHFQA